MSKWAMITCLILLLGACNNERLLISVNEYTVNTTWYVHPDSAFNSIQDALDCCIDCDTVLVAAGVYYENLVWPNTQGIYLTSESGAESTVIDGSHSGRVITILPEVDTSTVIKGFTIQNGEVRDFGAGILCGKFSSPKITGNIITANRVEGPGGLYGGGIYCDSFSLALIEGNTVSDNFGYLGGGGICGNHSSALIINNMISINNLSGDFFIHGVGGGILCINGGLHMICDNSIVENSPGGGMYAAYGAGIAVVNSSAQINDNWITYNMNGSNAGMGGGIYCDGSTVSVMYNTIVSNQAALGSGGGIAARYTTLTVVHCDISSNGARWYGGGIYCLYCTVSIDSCSITDNDIDGIYSESTGDSVTVHYSNIVGNAGYGLISTDAGSIVNAEYNWWGDPSGPGGAGPGSGDSVSLHVDYDPWLTEPVTIRH